jgi:hypothetical protein
LYELYSIGPGTLPEGNQEGQMLKIRDTLMPHMLPDVVPLVVPKMIRF